METRHRDNLLIQATLRELDRMGLTDLDSQAREVKRSGEAVRKWRAGETARLNKNSRPDVEAFLRRRGIDPAKLVISRETPKRHERRCTVDAAIRRIEALPIPEWEKTLRIDAVAATFRSVAMEAAERAAEARARALTADARAGETRAKRNDAPTLPGMEPV